MPDDFVHNDEILYRRISARRKLYKIKNDGTIEISSEAFSDRQLRVSVDRAKLCNNNPRYTLGIEPGVVVGLLANDVRNLDGLTRNDQKGNPLIQFRIDVEPIPLLENPAYAEIFALPAFENADRRGAFHRLCRRLVRLAEEKQSIVLFDD